MSQWSSSLSQDYNQQRPLLSVEPSPIHLAVSPKCGTFPGVVNDINSGINMRQYSTIVAFGDSYTEGGKYDGSPLDPPVVVPPNPLAGGRSTNGYTWVENLALDYEGVERVMDYAQGGAVTNLSLWPSNPRPLDFLMQTDRFFSQGHTDLDPDETLYVVFFGINDWIASQIDGDHMPAAALTLTGQLDLLHTHPSTRARNFLVLDVYGRGEHSASVEREWKQAVYDHLADLTRPSFKSGKREEEGRVNAAYVDFSRIWDAVVGGEPPGYEAFGYTTTEDCTSSCREDCTVDGWCQDPETRFYWIPGHPSKETHRIMADYVERVLEECSI